MPGDLGEDQPPYDPLTVVFTTDELSAEVVAFYRADTQLEVAVAVSIVQLLRSTAFNK